MDRSKAELKEISNFNSENIKVSAIITQGRSSSIFLQGLLEGHPNILTMPYCNFLPPTIESKKDLNTILKPIYNTRLKKDYETFNLDVKKELNYTKFKEHIANYLDVHGYNSQNLFYAMFYSYAKIKKIKLKDIQYILFQSHTIKTTSKLLKFVDKPNLIFTVRDPRSNIHSIAKHGEFSIGKLKLLITIYKFYELSKKKTRAIFVRHEDIHKDYKNTRKKICQFLKIKDDKALDYSSMCGVPFGGRKGQDRSLENTDDSKPNPKFANDKWKKELPRHQLIKIQDVAEDMMKTFKYKKENPKNFIESHEKIKPEKSKDFVVVFGVKYYLNQVSDPSTSRGLKFKVMKTFSKTPIVGNFLLKNTIRGYVLFDEYLIPYYKAKF